MNMLKIVKLTDFLEIILRIKPSENPKSEL